MAVQVSDSGTTLAQDRGRYPMRFASGIPVVAYSGNSTGALVLVKGNSINPTSFPTSLLSVSDVPYDLGNNTWVMISPTLAMCGDHFYSGMTQQVRQWTVNEAGTNNGGAVITTLDDFVNFTDRIFDTAVDSNGALHVIYTDMTTNMGTAYLTLYYINNVGGSWNTRVEIYGAGSTTNFANQRQPSIIIDSANLPIVSAPASSGTNTWKRGNANNATSFENQALSAGATYGHNTVGCDIRGNHYVFARQGAGDLRIDKHASGAGWGTDTNTTFSNKEFDQLYGVRIQGDYAYVIFKDQTNNASGVSIAKIDISGTTPTYVTTLERTSDDWFEWEATMKNSPLYHNYDKNGIDVGVSDLAKEIDLAFQLSDGAGAYDPYWENFQIAPTIALNTADSSSFTDTTPTLEQTGDEIFNLDTLEYDVQVMTDNLAVVDSYSESNYVSTAYTLRINGSPGQGQSFTGDGKYLTRATFYLSKAGSPTGFIKCKLYAHTGTFGSGGTATGEPLAVSTTSYDVSTLTTSMALINFEFDGSYQLVNGTNYVIMIEYYLGDVSNYVLVAYDGTSPTHGGATQHLNVSFVFQTTTSSDTIFYINGHTVLLDRKSDVDTTEFVNTVTGGDTHPFNDAEKIAFTVAYGTVDEYSIGADTTPSLNNTIFAWGQSFQGFNGDVTAVQFLLNKINTPTGNAVAKLYAHTGTYGSGGLPTGTALATSNTFDVSTLTTSPQWIKFVFPTPYAVSSGTNYVIVIEYLNGTVSNYVECAGDATASTHSGNIVRYTTVWTAYTYDMLFILDGSIELSVGTYYWRARARNEDLTGYWSETRNFDVTQITGDGSRIKVASWKDITSGSIAIGGTWKQIVSCSINIGDVWKPFVSGSF